MQVEEAQEVETTFAEFLNSKVKASKFTRTELTTKLDLYRNALNIQPILDFSTGRKHPSYASITKMLKNGLATDLALSDAELDEFIELWERKREQELTAEAAE